MSGRSMWVKKMVAGITTVCFLTVSTGAVFAQDSTAVSQPPQAVQAASTMSSASAAQAEDQARMDARSDVKGGTWFIVGCLLGLVGWIIAYVVEPNPPATRLLGQSPDYVAVYTDAYKREGKKVQSQKALSGCLVGTCVSVILEVILMSAAAP